MSQYLTTQEVADRLGVSVFTIRRYIRAGKLRAVKLDGAYRLSRDELAAFLRSRQIGSGAGSSGATDAPPPPERGAEEQSPPAESAMPEQTESTE
jgi:excisionase family DNA binding protein